MNTINKLGCQIATASIAVLMMASTASAASHTQGTVTVKRGDTLTSIAEEKLNDASMWQALCDANEKVLNGACDNLEIGTVLMLPADMMDGDKDAMMKDDGMEKSEEMMDDEMADDKMASEEMADKDTMMDDGMEKSEEMADKDKDAMVEDSMEKDTMEMTDKDEMETKSE